MALLVQHNLTAMNANRQLSITTGAQAKATEKLSSGYRINRAGDDAAGLTISEKMRSQIRGLNKASTNAQDGISLIQSAEGALNEAHSILQRMNELAVQGANDTNETIDRDAINKELDALTKELDRISTTTQFNKQNLLDGSFQDKNLQVGANANQRIAISIENMDAQSLGLKSIKYVADSAAEPQSGKKPIKFMYNGASVAYDLTNSLAANLSTAVVSFQEIAANNAASTQYAPQWNGKSVYYVAGDNTNYATAKSAMSVDIGLAKEKISTEIIGNADDYLKTENVTVASATVMAVGTIGGSGIANVSSYDAANATITAVQEAINKVSNQRSALGALQNRLEHTVANLDTVSENTSAAESRIRDTDMATAMVEYSKNNILAQAGQSMLAQANQSTQGVLSLLG